MTRKISVEMPEKVKILGISGSPRKNGNTAAQVKYCLKSAESMGFVETEYISLADYHFGYCTDCKKCIVFNKPAGDPLMCYDDPLDQQKVIREKEAQADALLVGWPVYGGHLPALVRMAEEHTYSGGSPFFNEEDPGKSARDRRYKPRAYIAQAGQHFGGQERTHAYEARGGLVVGSWPTLEDPEPQASYMGGIVTSVDGKSVYANDSWTTGASRINPPLTAIRNERTLRNLGRWLAVSAMMMKIGVSLFQAAGLPALTDQYFVRYAAGKPKPGSVLERLIKEGKVTYVPPEELESRKKVKA
ncbi:MAG: flavodoxin family protein [Chloroflexi bacterium]|nr:flavodoxin family protein [Chloroflexota bacterium]